MPRISFPCLFLAGTCVPTHTAHLSYFALTSLLGTSSASFPTFTQCRCVSPLHMHLGQPRTVLTFFWTLLQISLLSRTRRNEDFRATVKSNFSLHFIYDTVIFTLSSVARVDLNPQINNYCKTNISDRSFSAVEHIYACILPSKFPRQHGYDHVHDPIHSRCDRRHLHDYDYDSYLERLRLQTEAEGIVHPLEHDLLA
jgi:hypothetical protein